MAHIQQNKNDFLLDKLEFVLDAIQKNLYFPEKQMRIWWWFKGKFSLFLRKNICCWYSLESRF